MVTLNLDKAKKIKVTIQQREFVHKIARELKLDPPKKLNYASAYKFIKKHKEAYIRSISNNKRRYASEFFNLPEEKGFPPSN